MSAAPDFRTVTPSAFSGSPASAKAAKPAQQGFGFDDLLDTINPLQHIPIVGSIYRAITGDAMSPTAEIAGGALFGGIVGVLSSIADVMFAQATGKGFGDSVVAWLGFKSNPQGGTRLAETHIPSASSASLPTPKPAPLAIDPAIAARAAFAYRSAIALQDPASMPGLSLSH